MKRLTFLLFLLVGLASCDADGDKPNPMFIKMLVLFGIAGVSVLIRSFRDKSNNKTYAVEDSTVVVEEPIAEQIAQEENNVKEEQVNSIAPSLPESVWFHRRNVILQFVLLPILPLFICFANPGLGLGLSFVFLIIAAISGYKYNEKIAEENYKKIGVQPDRLMFYKEDYSDEEILLFRDVKQVTFYDNYETSIHGIERRVGTYMTFHGDGGKVWTSIDYRKYQNSTYLKELILYRLKAK